MDRDEFVRGMIAALSSKRESSAAWDRQERSAEDVFHKLRFDMPDVAHADLEALNAALRSMVLEGEDAGALEAARWFSMQPGVVDNLLHLTAQHQSSEAAENAVRPLQQVASQLCATMFLEVPLYLMRRGKRECAQLLSGYLIALQDAQVVETPAASDQPPATQPENTPENGADRSDVAAQSDSEEVYAAEEDPDDFVYEGDPTEALESVHAMNRTKAAEDVTVAVAQSSVDVDAIAEADWRALESALLQLWRNISYSSLSTIDHATWEAVNLTSTLCQLIRTMRQPSADNTDHFMHHIENRLEVWSTCAFILRERMIHHPQTIPTLLESLLRVLDSPLLTKSRSRRQRQIPVEDIIGASVIGSLCQVVQQSQHRRTQEYLQSFISTHLDALIDTIEQLLKEDLVSAIDILCSCIGLVVDVDFEHCKVLKPASKQQFDKLLVSRAVAIAVSAFVSSIQAAAETMDGALVAALKKLELTITGLTFLSSEVANFVARFATYTQLFTQPGAVQGRVVVYVINPLVRMRVCLGMATNASPLPPQVAEDVTVMLRDSIPVALDFDHAFARAAFTEDTTKTLQMLSGLAPSLFSVKSTLPEIGDLLHDRLVVLLQRLREWTDDAAAAVDDSDAVKAAHYLSASTQATCIASLKNAISRLQGESSNKID